jgi:GNAT superfamily N-acetyltransferase
MWWRQTRSEFGKMRGSRNRKALKRIVGSGEVPGLIAYIDGKPAGWCSVAPRETFSRLERSRVLKRVDEEPVWSVACFFVARPFRRRGLTVPLLRAATDFAREHGARIIEGYPIDPRKGAMPDAWAWTGFAAAFLRAGFKEVERRSPTRPIMRRRAPRKKGRVKEASRGME